MTTTTHARAAHLGPERRRPQVLDAALDIAAEEGVGAISVAAVAQRLGVTRPVVYACYPDRVAMIRALVDREQDRMLTGTLAALPPRDVTAPEEVFVAGFQALLTTVAAHPTSWRVVFDSAPDAAVAAYFGQARRLVAAQFERLIVPTLRAWGTTDVEAKLPVLVELFMSSGEAAVRSLLAGGSTWTPETLGEFVGKAVHRAMRDA